MASQGTGLLHAEYEQLSALAGYGVRAAGVAGLLTDAQVVAATSAEDLVAILDTPPGTAHADQEITAINAQRALQRGDALGDFTDARIQAATTVEGVAELTEAANESDLGHLGPRII